MLVAVGRVPYTDGLGLDEAGVALDERGRVKVDDHFADQRATASTRSATSSRGPMLAHKAEEEGVAVAEILAGQAGHVNYDVDPERRLHHAGNRLGRQDRGRAEGRRHRLQGRQVPVPRQWRAPRPTSTTDGFVKILADAKTDRVLGVHISAPTPAN